MNRESQQVQVVGSAASLSEPRVSSPADWATVTSSHGGTQYCIAPGLPGSAESGWRFGTVEYPGRPARGSGSLLPVMQDTQANGSVIRVCPPWLQVASATVTPRPVPSRRRTAVTVIVPVRLWRWGGLRAWRPGRVRPGHSPEGWPGPGLHDSDSDPNGTLRLATVTPTHSHGLNNDSESCVARLMPAALLLI